MNPPLAPGRTWRDALASYTHPRVLGMLCLGFAAGLPFLLVFSTLSAWLTESGVSRATIGFFSWVGITYSIKVLWAPVVDRVPLPWLTRRFGRRRSWLLLAQASIALALVAMAFTDPAEALAQVAVLAVIVAFASATQDVSLDAYHIEAVEPALQGVMASTYITGYRVGLLAAGAGAFYIAEFWSWSHAYLAMAGLMSVGLVTVLASAEPQPGGAGESRQLEARVAGFLERSTAPPRLRRLGAWFIGAVICPFVDFFERHGRTALVILAFIAVYRISDITMGIMANPFYLDLGFSKTDIANVTKVFGFFMSIAGAALGGLLVVRFGVMRPLLAGAVLVAATNLLFALLASRSPDLTLLALVISADNLSGGLAGAAFIAYLSGLTNTAYTATQYALFSSLMTLPAKFLGGFSGLVVESAGYETFFVLASALGLPAIALVLYLGRATRRGEAVLARGEERNPG